jgi:hypothetical protein
MSLHDYTLSVLRSLGFLPRPNVELFAADLRLDAADDLSRLFFSHNGRRTHKWGQYLPVYERHFSSFRNKPVKLLEIGVCHGGSLQLWQKYFGSDATIFGIDIDPRAKIGDDGTVSVRIGSQADPLFLKSVVTEMGGVDIVIDDGSHIASHQRISFETLFPLLSDGGLYLAEDLHTSYWRIRRKGSFIEEMKLLIDDIHFWYHQKPQRFSKSHLNVGAIHFYDSMVVIEKRKVSRPYHMAVGTPSF